MKHQIREDGICVCVCAHTNTHTHTQHFCPFTHHWIWSELIYHCFNICRFCLPHLLDHFDFI